MKIFKYKNKEISFRLETGEVISSEKNPYRAVLRLVKSVGNKYVLTNIDRNRRLWK